MESPTNEPKRVAISEDSEPWDIPLEPISYSAHLPPPPLLLSPSYYFLPSRVSLLPPFPSSLAPQAPQEEPPFPPSKRPSPSSISFEAFPDPFIPKMSFSRLSPELILNIFAFLDNRTLAFCCAHLNRLCRSLAAHLLRERPTAYHEDFLLSRTPLWVDTNHYCTIIDDHMRNFSSPLVITGEPGSGKSSLLANWIIKHSQMYPETLILYHFVGCTSHSTDHHNLLHRCMRTLKESGAILEDIPSAFANLQPKFQQWLQMVSHSREIVIVIDALDQLDNEDGAHSLDWLPLKFPKNIKLLVSTDKGALLDTCTRKREWPQLRLKPFSVEEKRILTSRFLLTTTFNTLSEGQVKQILNSDQTSNPLFLCVLMRNLVLFDPLDALDEHLQTFLKTTNAVQLFIEVIKCIEEYVFKKTQKDSLIKDLLSFIFVAKNGLSERELREIMELDDDTWETIQWWLRTCITVKSGLFSVTYDAFGEAIEKLYFNQQADIEKACSKLATYFNKQLKSGQVSNRITEELPWLLEKSRNYSELKKCLSNIFLFEKLFETESKYDLFCYWINVGTSSREIAELYENALCDFEKSPQSTQEQVAYLAHRLGEYMRDSGHYREAVSFFNKALAIRESLHSDYGADVALTMNELGRLYFRLGKNKETLQMWETAYKIREKLKHGRQDHDIAISLNNLGLIYDKLGKQEKAERAYQTSLSIYLKVVGSNHPDVSITYHNLGLLYAGQPGCLPKSEEMYLKALAIKETYYGKHHNELAMTLNNLALVYSKMNQLDKAAKLYNKALNIKEEYFGGEHPDVALFLFNLGACYAKMHQRSQAKQCLLRALRIRKKIHGPDDEATLAVRSWVTFYGWSEDEE